MNLYLIRHGLSLGNCYPEIYHKMLDWKVPLTDEGEKQAEKAGKELVRRLPDYYPMTIITSPYTRALETTEIIKKQYKETIPIFETPLVREREWGHLREEVKSFETREERSHLFDFYRRPVGGESFADCYQRAFIFLQSLIAKERHMLNSAMGWKTASNTVIISHGEFLKVLLMIIDGNTVEQFDSLPEVGNCDIIERRVTV